MRASRLLSILLLLQARGRMTARELADELEVSLRTVYRDVEALSAAGVPVYADRGPAGGYRLLDGYRTRLTGLQGDEAQSLALAGIPGQAAELGLGEVLAAAQLKLMAALPPELRSRAGRIRERFHLDAPAWFRGAAPVPHLTVVADAVWNQRQLQVRYQRWDRKTEVARTLDPLGVVLKSGTWYLVARSTDQVRVYRVSRLLSVEILPERFTRPEDFDLTSYWRGWAERFEASVYRAEAVVRLSPQACGRVPILLGSTISRAVRETASEPDEDGWVRAVIPIESVEHARIELLKLGEGAEALEPPELRARLAETATALVDLYHL